MRNFIYIACCIISIVACRPAKKVQRIEEALTKKDTAHTVADSASRVDSLTLVKKIINTLSINKIDFTTFSGKVKIDYEGKENSDQATANIRMQKDSLIWISLTGLLGIEGYRLLVNKDSVKLMNKLNKTVQYRSISYLQEITQIPVDFYSLQDVIIGNPIFLDTNIVSFRTQGNQLLILMVGKLFKNLLTLENTGLKVVHSKLDDIDPVRNRTCDITMEGYERAGSINFSTLRKISVAEKSKLDINLQFKQYAFNEPQTFPFNIPKNYTRK